MRIDADSKNLNGDRMREGTLNAAIVGLGWWGRNLVASVQGKSERLRFVRGVSKEPETVRDFAAQHGIELSTDIADALGDPRVQAVVLATPHSLHTEQVEAAAAAGKPVFCEKPLALTPAGAARSVAACKRAGVVLGIGYNRRFWPSMREQKRLVKSGELGEILHLEGHFSNENSGTGVFSGWRESPQESPGGGMTGTGLHVLDAFVNIAGPVARAQAQLLVRKSLPAPLDTLSVLFEFESGVSAMLGVVRATPRYWRVHAFGARGSAEVVGEAETALVLRLSGEAPKRISFEPTDTLRLELETFADAVAGSAPYPIRTEEMTDTVAAFDAVVRSIASGGWVVPESAGRRPRPQP